jgi:hypothetical protein
MKKNAKDRDSFDYDFFNDVQSFSVKIDSGYDELMKCSDC